MASAPFTDADRIAWLRLARSEGVGPATFRDLIERYGSADAALDALPALARQAGRDRPPRIPSRGAAESELAAIARLGGGTLALCEPAYPAALAAIPDAPPILTWRGNLGLLASPAIAIVGARNASAGGCRLAETLARDLGEAGLVVVSGLARGIDAAAHRGALATGTIAVFAGGLDVIYPAENETLAGAIAERGLIVAELAPGTQPLARNFPRRNRIVAGLARATLVVEAAIRSGSLTTARLAAEQGREVMAVPGHPLDPRAEGTNRLIKDGATMVTSAEDVLRALAYPTAPPAASPDPTAPTAPLADGHLEEPAADTRDRIISALGPAPVNVDELARATDLPIRMVQVALIELALAGRIELHGAHLVSLKPEQP
jgi:DNA processing protein